MKNIFEQRQRALRFGFLYDMSKQRLLDLASSYDPFGWRAYGAERGVVDADSIGPYLDWLGKLYAEGWKIPSRGSAMKWYHYHVVMYKGNTKYEPGARLLSFIATGLYFTSPDVIRPTGICRPFTGITAEVNIKPTIEAIKLAPNQYIERGHEASASEIPDAEGSSSRKRYFRCAACGQRQP